MDAEGESIALDDAQQSRRSNLAAWAADDTDDSVVPTAETQFGGTAGTVDGTTVVAPAESPTFIAMREAAVSTAMLSSYEVWDISAGGAPVTRPDASMFVLNSSDELMLKDFPNVRLTYHTRGDLVRTYALSSIQRDNPGIGLRAIRDGLGYEDYGLKTHVDAQLHKPIISIATEHTGALTVGEFQWSFGNGGSGSSFGNILLWICNALSRTAPAYELSRNWNDRGGYHCGDCSVSCKWDGNNWLYHYKTIIRVFWY